MAGERFNPKKADKLIDPKRFELLQPDKVIDSLGLREGDTVADLGAGNGFFTIPLAEKTKSKVYAVDIEPDMLSLLKERSEQMNSNITNIHYVVSDLEEIKLESHSIDKAISSLVLHEVPNLQKALHEIKRILRPGGQLFIIEWEAVESEMGPPLHERIGSDEMIEIVKERGFEVERTLEKDSIYGLSATLRKQ
ncbi:class I SAM-dependent methyltransferase [Salipaludibacillus sp. CF4.18]|uniref:class I SAM-dependent methyltransferase n=1 Tax=Salipaludibacillus sp. CF4.18 TaxID=3373081 RepID=UPI003EE6BA57